MDHTEQPSTFKPTSRQWLIPALIGLAALQALLLLPRLKGVTGEAMVGRRLDRLFGEVLHDIIVPDGCGGLTIWR